jgi:hypothetical protein
MSRTNTAAYESIKASQIVFQNPDRSFPEPGAVLAIDNLRGATTWSRNLDVDSVALAGPSSVGILTYDNQLLVNGVPVGGGGADVSGGSNIHVDLSGGVQRVSLDVREDIDMCSNSIINCKTIELPRIPNTSSAKITFGSIADSAYGIVSYEDSINTLLITSDKNVEVRGSAGVLTVGETGISRETYFGKPISGVVKTGFSTKVSAMELTETNTLVVGATDISGFAPTLSLVDNAGSGSIRYVNPNIQTSKSIQIYTPNPQIVLQDSTNNKAAAVSFAGGSETLNMSAKNVSMISNAMGSVTIDSFGKTTSITNARISDSIYSTGGVPLSAAILTPNNTYTVGSVDISLNPVIVLQGGKDPVLANKKKARIEFFDASGELRISADHYALNDVPSGSYSNVLGYDTSSGEIKSQPAGISPLAIFTYDASGSISSPSGTSSLGTFTPSTSGVYSITFSVALSNSSETAIQFNNTFEAFRLGITPGFTYPVVRISGIQNRVNSVSPTTDIYGTTIMEQLSAGITYTIQASHETTSLGPSTSAWATCVPRVRIVRLC